ncbi:MAG TPA: glycosyltransferase [Vicinamibacterales bacterium]|nr:glycosyltransferase [Vicinamibacterales bacterium]
MTTSVDVARLPLLILNDELPTFQGSGGNEFLCTLHLQRHGLDVGVVSMAHFRRDLAGIQRLKDAGVKFYLWESPWIDAPPPDASRPWLRRTHSALFRAWVASRAGAEQPLDTVLVGGSFRNLAAPLLQALRQRTWPVVTVIQTHAAAIVDLLPRPLVSVLVMHDIRALVFERRAVVETSAWARRRWRREAARYRGFEKAQCQKYDLVVTMSDEDADWVRTHYRPKRVTVRRLPVDAHFFAPASAGDEVAGRLMFTGLMNHPPNVDAATFMAREVFPKIRAARPDAEFWIVGRHPAPAVEALAALPGVRVTGGVDDIRSLICSAQIVVVPLRYGSGARNKIVEAWALEKCVVSTTSGAEGLSYDHGLNLFIADGAAALASTIVRLFEDAPLRHSVRTAGRRLVTSLHDPAAIAQGYAADVAAVLREKVADTEPLRVAIDLRWMIPGVAGGIENVARSLLRELFRLDHQNRYTLLLPDRARHDLDVRRNRNVRILTPDAITRSLSRMQVRASALMHRAARFDYWRSAEVEQLRFLAELDAELVYSLPGYINADVLGLPQVLMVPDIQHEFLPEFFAPAALEERIRVYRGSIAQASHICAISEFTRQTLIDRLGVPPDRVTTVLLAADPIFRESADAGGDAAVLSGYELTPERYVFFPGHTWLHKNHLGAIAAMRVLRDRHGVTVPLVCTGGAREAQGQIADAVAAAGLDVRFLGYCDRHQLPALYRRASCLLFPSLFEGFGMPVLEAMASGCPVVCSNTTSLPEIAGDAAELVDPANPEAIAAALADVLRDPERRGLMQRRGRINAARFSWQRHAIETLAVLRSVRRGMAEPAAHTLPRS